MSTGAWVLVFVLVTATGFGLYRAYADGRFRGTPRVRGVDPVPDRPEEPVSVLHGSDVDEPLGERATLLRDLQSTDRREFAGRTVVTYTTDYSGEELDGRVVALGATPHRAATAETAVRLGRLLGHPVVMPRSLLRTYLADSDRELVTPRFGGPRLSLVTRVPTAPYWKSALPGVGRELGLSGVSAHT